MMRVLHIVSDGKIGGLQSHVLCISSCLRSNGVDARVCIVGASDSLGRQLNALQIPFYALNGRSGHDFKAFCKFAQLVKSFKPDVVHFHDNPLLPMAYYKFFDRKQKVVASLHISWIPRCNIRMRLQRWLRRRINFFLPVSQATWDSYLKDSPKAKGKVFFNPVKIDTLPVKDEEYIRKELMLPKDAQIIGAIGRISRVKDIPSFLKVSRILLDQRKTLHAIVVGDGELLDTQRGLWEALTSESPGIKDRLHWLGKRIDARELIGGMDVLVLTSFSEEMPTVLLEAFGMHTVVAGFIPSGGTAEVLALSGGMQIAALNPNRDVVELAETISKLLDDADNVKKITENAYRCLLKNFNAAELCKHKLISIYEGVVRNG